MKKEQDNLNETLLEIYTKNMIFFKENFKSLYNDLEVLSISINNGTHKEKYTLELVEDYFDILNHENNGYFYNINSYDDAVQRSQKASFDTTNSLDLLRKGIDNKHLLNSELYKDITPIIDHLNTVVDFDNVEFQKIFKFVYINTGLGFHIQEINKKLNSFTTLIIEEELEIFRLSLFTTDYTIFDEDNKKLFLSIGEDKNNRQSEIKEFSDYHKYMNYNIKYNTLLADGIKIKEELVHFFAYNNAALFPYKLVLDNLEKLVGFIKNKDRFLNRQFMFEKKILKDKKVLMISAGPSVDEYIQWIAQNQDKFIIIAVDVIVHKLEVHNVIPDIVVSIDPQDECKDYITTKNKDYLKNTSFLFLSQQSSKIMDYVKDKKYYFSQVMPLVEELGYLGSTPNVGTYAFELAIYLGANELYLIGNDAAFDQKTGNRYAQNAGYSSVDEIEIKETESNKTVSMHDVIEVKGNFQDKVKTNLELSGFRDNYIVAINNFFDDGIKFKGYNLSSGAFIDGLIPCTKKELEAKIKDYSYNKGLISEDLDKVSQTVDKLDFSDDIKIINTIITRTKNFQKIKLSSKDDFLQNKLDLMIWILEKTKEMSSSVYGQLFLEYTSLVDIYINYFLNLRQNGLHKKEEINKVAKMWSKGTLTMFKDIKNSLK